MSSSAFSSNVRSRQDSPTDGPANGAGQRLRVLDLNPADMQPGDSAESLSGISRAQASLEATPRGDASAPARLPQSLPSSRGSDDGSSSRPESCSHEELSQSRTANLRPVGPPSLPGSVDPSGSSRWDLVRQRSATPPHQRAMDSLMVPPESSDYLHEDQEIDELSRSPEFFAEHARDSGFSMLHFVAMLGHKTLADALRVSTTEIHHRYARIAKCLLWKHKVKLYATDKYGCTPLQLAAACGNLEMVKVLLEPYEFDTSGQQVVDPGDPGYEYLNHQDDQMQFSALHGAVSHNEYEVVILLLKYGANPQVLDVTRCTAFKAAPTLGSLQELLRLVLQHAAEVPRPVIVHLMAEVLDRQLKEAGSAGSGSRSGRHGHDDGHVSAELHDVKAQREFKAQQRWSKAAKLMSFKILEGSADPAKRFSAAALEMVGHAQNADVGATIERHFGELYGMERHEVLVEYLILAINSNQHKLTKIMIDVVCDECPDVLAAPKWHEVLEPLVSSYPTLFHRLLFKLQDMRDEHVQGFVRCLSPAKFQAAQEVNRPQSAPPGSQQLTGGSRTHAADRVKLLIYQQLVEGLRKVRYRVVKTFLEESDQKLLNDMAQFPIFAEFVGLIANMQTAKAFDESDSSRKLLLALLRAPNDDEGPGAYDNAEQAPSPPAPAARGQGPVPRPSGGTTVLAWSADENKRFFKQGSSRVCFAVDVHAQPSAETGPVGRGRDGAEPESQGDRHARDGARVAPAGRAGDAAARRPPGRSQSRVDEAAQRRERLSLQTLNVHPVLWAAVKAGKAYNVETAVMSIISWVETNSKDGKAVFLTGISADLIQELAMRFPTSCATLLNLVSRDVLEQLTTLQVSANVLYGKDHLVKCSHVRNHFTWREQELRKLQMIKGFDEHVVDALVDYGVPFECVYKAAVEMSGGAEEHATVEQFAKLIEHEFSGPELKELISNGIRLSKVIGYIEECGKPPPDGVHSDFASQLDVPMSVLIRDMLREGLSPRIVDIILREEKMFETTKYNNFRPGRPLRRTYPERLFVPKYTHHFVQMLLINWRRGVKNEKGVYTIKPWAKEYIDTIFEPNDPLCTKLRSAYDNKLTDTQVYIQGEDAPDAHESRLVTEQRELRARQEREQEQREHRQHIRRLLRIFISKPLLLHRWPVFVMAQLSLLVHAFLLTNWQRLEDRYYRWRSRRLGHQVSLAKKARSGTIDAAVLAFPILGFVQPEDGDILTALVDADAPSSWFNYAIVRALYGLHWSSFGRVMIFLSAAIQLQFSIVFLVFFLLVLNYRPNGASDDDLDWLSGSPVIEVVLATCTGLSISMLLERAQEAQVPQLGTWVFFGRTLELACHGMVWTVAIIVWSGTVPKLVPALSGLTMLMFVARLTLFGLVTEKLSTAVLALMEIISDSRYFFLLIGVVYGGFILAVAGLRETDGEPQIYTAQLFTVLLGDFQSTQLTDDNEFWRFSTFSLILLSVYAVLMLIVFMNLLIATMNDTYDRVKEFCEVEVMRLRSHMMVFVKDFIKRNAKQSLALDGDVLHLLLRPEEVKSGRWLAQSGAEPSEYSAWAGRITYMRSSIVREVESALRFTADRQMEQLATIDLRLGRVEARLGPAPAGERLSELERRMEAVEKGADGVFRRPSEAAGGPS